jgi:hypothetical protein
MPHPGLKVTNRRDFDGRLGGLEWNFTEAIYFISKI